jgi:hypothetical protein
MRRISFLVFASCLWLASSQVTRAADPATGIAWRTDYRAAVKEAADKKKPLFLYDRMAPAATGWYESEVFPGLGLDAAALVRGDLATVLNVVQQGIASPRHSAFVQELRAKAATK